MNWEKLIADPFVLGVGVIAIVVIILIVCITIYEIVSLKYKCRHHWEKDGDVYRVAGRCWDDELGRERDYEKRYQKFVCTLCGETRVKELP